MGREESFESTLHSNIEPNEHGAEMEMEQGGLQPQNHPLLMAHPHLGGPDLEMASQRFMLQHQVIQGWAFT